MADPLEMAILAWMALPFVVFFWLSARRNSKEASIVNAAKEDEIILFKAKLEPIRAA
ncbi:hypothetical protein [Yoonia algicola]|uniref:Uncharacterized protein n=1 Tax=Yoonia algicola TaxID=3137368 RepID=A0AAN0MC10_9RHOB